ncbi:MAG: TIGR02391 family protein [Candidatus Marinimicrobia bacterium]|jgi:uncharacterized protein (TIGR02391 family)|nr:TIGR02391 family protein [Candidatus Neomarinimicrobiota bacterium]
MADNLNRAIQFKEKLHSLINLVGDESVLDNDSYIQERNFFINNYSQKIPSFLKNCRTLSDFKNELRNVASGNGSWQVRRKFIENEFSDFLNFLEFGEVSDYNEANIQDNKINIVLQKEVFSHVKTLLNSKHYFNAVEESYKTVRNKLKEITGEEQAHKAFAENNYIKIFGHEAQDEVEKDFFEGIKFLHMAIQKLRNEKAHTPAQKIDKNLAIHYIVLASLAYDLINRN